MFCIALAKINEHSCTVNNVSHWAFVGNDNSAPRLMRSNLISCFRFGITVMQHSLPAGHLLHVGKIVRLISNKLIYSNIAES